MNNKQIVYLSFNKSNFSPLGKVPVRLYASLSYRMSLLFAAQIIDGLRSEYPKIDINSLNETAQRDLLAALATYNSNYLQGKVYPAVLRKQAVNAISVHLSGSNNLFHYAMSQEGDAFELTFGPSKSLR